MAQNNIGTLITSPIRPQSTQDSFPSAYSNELKGGHHQVATLSDRDLISNDRRQEGMLCSVISEQKTYQLVGGILNSNWQTFNTGSNQGSLIDDTTAASTSKTWSVNKIKLEISTKGDMLKSQYDTNGDGKVDSSENSDKLGGQPSSYFQKSIVIQPTAPLVPLLNDLWVDNSSSPYSLKTWNGSLWVESGLRTRLFTALTDSPASYTGHAGKIVSVKNGEDGLEFIAIPAPKVSNWATTRSYKINQIVIYNNKLYRCKVDHISNDFLTEDYNWDLISDGIDTTTIKLGQDEIKSSSVEFIEGDDINIKPDFVNNTITFNASKEGKIYDWMQDKEYIAGEYIVVGNCLYKAKDDHLSTNIFDESHWIPVNGIVTVNSKNDLPQVGSKGLIYVVLNDVDVKGKPTQYVYNSSYEMIIDNTGVEIDDNDFTIDKTWSSQKISNELSSKLDTTDSSIHMPEILGTKTVDESNIADGRVLSYNATSGKLEYVTVAGAGMGSGGTSAPLSVLLWHRESAPFTRPLPQTIFTVPQYNVGDNSVEIYIDGNLKSVEEDYIEINDTTIEFTQEITEEKRVIFRCKAVNFISGGFF